MYPLEACWLGRRLKLVIVVLFGTMVVGKFTSEAVALSANGLNEVPSVLLLLPQPRKI